ncbi:hypothetical protein V1264_019961 [Littorina saxatilis]|uniref:Uncharacterized protein n=1 Tax=Littorina saxatilis TaxID=31220 RepID=A0AAN9B958_9CAEN
MYCQSLSAVVSAGLDLLDDPGVQGPEPLTKRTKRGLENVHDCPRSWTMSVGIASMPSMPCPPGQERPPSYGGPPFSPYPRSRSPCPPWVDDTGRCHINDLDHDATRCRQHYGEDLYAQWQRNAHLAQPVGPPGTPAPPCRPGGGGLPGLPGGYGG